MEDIVRGDARRAFYARRVELRVDGTAPGPWSVQSQQETVAYVLGQTPTDTGGPVAAGRDHQPTEVATLAAFLQNAELTGERAGDDEKQQIAYLRQSLLTQISAATQAQNNSLLPNPPHPVSQSQSSGTQFAQGVTYNNARPTPAGTDGAPPRWRPQPNQSLVQAAEAQSILGGLFGMGTVMQYEQYAIMQSVQQQPRN